MRLAGSQNKGYTAPLRGCWVAKLGSLGSIMRRLLIAAFSTGWLLPMWISAQSLYTFLDAEVWPRLRGQEPLNSFPFVHFSLQAFTVAVVWLAAVVFFWAWRLSGVKKETHHDA
jgi:hypothetical protein